MTVEQGVAYTSCPNGEISDDTQQRKSKLTHILQRSVGNLTVLAAQYNLDCSSLLMQS